MKVHEYREMMRYLTRKPLSDREVELAYTDHMQKLNAPAPMPVASGEQLGTREGFRDGTETLSINPMLDNVNPNTIGGGAVIPALGVGTAIAVKKIADERGISFDEAVGLLKRLYTGPSVLQKTIDTPEGKVYAPDDPIPAKPDIEKFPSGEKQETTLVTKKPDQIKKLPGFEIDKSENTNILFNRKPDTEKQKIVEKTFIDLKEKLGRDPSVTEVADKLNIHVQSADNFLRDLDFTRQVGSARFVSYKEIGDPKVTKIINTSEGNKWPNQATKDSYEYQIIERTKYPQNSTELKKKYETGELLINEELAKKYNIGLRSVENINAQIQKDYKLEKPVLGREETRREKDLERQKAKEKFTSPSFESREAGTLDVNLGHAGDLYNIPVKLETLTATPKEINQALRKLDYLIKDVYQKQKELIDKKPKNWEKDLKRLNDIGIEYSSQSEGYKTFEPIDLKTLERKPVLIDYSKIIDPTGIYVDKKGKGKTTIEAEKEINLTEFNKIEKAFSDAINARKIADKEGRKVDLSKIKNAELITEENWKKLKNYKEYKMNYEAVFEKERKRSSSEIEDIVKKLEKIKKIKYATGGRVKLQNGSDDGYTQEIPSLGFSDPIDILEQQMINEKDVSKILILNEILNMEKEKKFKQETEAAEYKKSQKEKGVRYKEDFPSEAAYFAETGKQLLTNPKYFLSKGAKGVVEGTEFLVGQPLQTLFSQTGKNFEFYQPVAGEKLGINKYIEENIPKNPTTGTLLAGETAEIAGSVLDPFLAYGIVKGATNALKTKAPVVIEETIDPTRRDLLKMGAVITGGAIAYPTAKKLGLLDTSVKVAKTGNAVRIATSGVVNNMPEFFPYLSEFSLARGKVIGQDYMRSGMTEFKRELTIPLEITTGGKKTNVKFEFIHDPAEGNVTAYYTNPLTDEKHSFDFYSGKQGKQAYGIDPEHPGAYEYYTVEVEPPGFDYRYPDKADPYRKNIESYSTSSEGDEVVEALDKWYKGLSKEEKAKFENKFITHSEYTDEIPAASYNTDENYPIMEFMYPKKKND